MQGPSCAREVMEAVQRLDRRRRRRRHRHRPRRRVRRGPAAVLRRGPGAGGRRRRGPRSSRPSATSPTPRSSTWSPTSGPRRRPTPPSCSSPTSARSSSASPSCADRARRHLTTWLAPRARPAGQPPGPAGPRRTHHGARRSGRREVDRARRRAPAVRSATAWTGPPTTSTTPGPASGRCRRARRCAAATPCVQDADGHVLTSADQTRGRRPRHRPALLRPPGDDRRRPRSRGPP